MKNDENRDAFEDAYKKFKREHVNASFMPKDMAEAMWKSALFHAQSLKVQLPDMTYVGKAAADYEDKHSGRFEDLSKGAIAYDCYCRGAQWVLDQITLEPMDIEKLLPSEESLMEQAGIGVVADGRVDIDEIKSYYRFAYRFIRSHLTGHINHSGEG